MAQSVSSSANNQIEKQKKRRKKKKQVEQLVRLNDLTKQERGKKKKQVWLKGEKKKKNKSWELHR